MPPLPAEAAAPAFPAMPASRAVRFVSKAAPGPPVQVSLPQEQAAALRFQRRSALQAAGSDRLRPPRFRPALVAAEAPAAVAASGDPPPSCGAALSRVAQG